MAQLKIFLLYCNVFFTFTQTKFTMGKGDQRSKRGKIHIGTSGVSRPKRKKKASVAVAAAAPKKAAPKKAAKKAAKKAE